MTIPHEIWLIKLVLAHLLTDFILQPTSWVADRKAKHFGSGKLYLHGLVTGAAAWLFTGLAYWKVAAVIAVTHTLIDAWKSYMAERSAYFIADQILHLLVIGLCFYFTFFDPAQLNTTWAEVEANGHAWALIAAATFLTTPAGILIGQLTKGWREKIDNPESLANAGKWIGMIERMIVLILVMMNQFSAISLLIAAKGIIRFNEKDRPEVKTEYLVIGTLMSIGIAMLTGIALHSFFKT